MSGIEADVDPLGGDVALREAGGGATQEFRRRAAALDERAPVDSTEVIAYVASTRQTAQIAKMAIDASSGIRRSG
jgi:hypothetical protein